MTLIRLKLYKYPIFVAFLAFWGGIYLSPYGWYSIIGFIFGLMLLKYTLGSDIIYPLLFFLSGFLYAQERCKNKIPEGTIAVRAMVLSKNTVEIDSIIGKNAPSIEGSKLRIMGLSGFERGDIIEALVKVEKKRPLPLARIIKIKKAGSKNTLVFKINRFLKQKVEELSDKEDVRGFMLGVLLGYRDFIPSDVMDDFKRTGTMHILALSGLHVGILLAFIYFLIFPLAGHRNPALLIASLIVLFYMIVVGTSPSIFRAYLLILTGIIVKISKRRTSILCALGIAGFVGLILYPDWAFSYSFMLSYLAVFGIIHFSQLSRNRYLQYLFVSLGAVLFTFPITAYLSGYFPIFSFLFNLIVIPIFGITLVAFFVIVALYLLFPPLHPVYLFISNLIGSVFLKIIHLLSGISPVLKIKISNPVSVTVYYLVLLSLPVIITTLKDRLLKKQEVSIESS